MRATVYILILALTLVYAGHAASKEPSAQKKLPLLQARGFLPHTCYRHSGSLNCGNESEDCKLEIFSGSSRLTFLTSIKDLKKLLNAQNWGEFVFKTSEIQAAAAKVQIIDWQPKSLSALNENAESGLAKKVDCPKL